MHYYIKKYQNGCIKLFDRAPDKKHKIHFNRHYMCYFFTKSQGDYSNKWSNLGFGEEIPVGIIETNICSLSGALILISPT